MIGDNWAQVDAEYEAISRKYEQRERDMDQLWIKAIKELADEGNDEPTTDEIEGKIYELTE